MSDYKIELLDKLGNRQFPITLTDCISDKDGVNLNSLLNEKSRVINLDVYCVSYFDLIDDNGNIVDSPSDYILNEINNFYTPEVKARNNSYFKDGIFDLNKLQNDIIICNNEVFIIGNTLEGFSIAYNDSDILWAGLGYDELTEQPILLYVPRHWPAELLFDSLISELQNSEESDYLIDAIFTMLLLTVIFYALGIKFIFEKQGSALDQELIIYDSFDTVLNVTSPLIGVISDEIGSHCVLWLGNFSDLNPCGAIYLSKCTWHYYSTRINTYEDILNASVCGALIPGNEYIIQDYQTIVDSSCGVKSDENNYLELIVKAKDNFSLEEEAVVRKNWNYDEWTEDLNPCTITKVKYSLDNNKNLYPWVCENSYLEIEESYLGHSKFYKTNMVAQGDDGIVYRIWRLWHLGSPAIAKILGSLVIPDGIQIGDIFTEPLDGTPLTVKNIVDTKSSKGFIYEMIDMYGNQAPWDFVSLSFALDENGFSTSVVENNNQWYPTFYCYNYDNGKNNLYYHTYYYSGDYQFSNNKIIGIPIGEKVIMGALNGTYSLKNVTIESGNVIAEIPDNSTIGKGCDGLRIKDKSESHPIINVLPGTKIEGTLLLKEDFGKISDNLVYIGKNSNGQIKMWNPADLIN